MYHFKIIYNFCVFKIILLFKLLICINTNIYTLSNDIFLNIISCNLEFDKTVIILGMYLYT